MDLRENLVATLRAHEAELRAAGIGALSLFGSVARHEERQGSDVDLAVRLDPAAHVGVFGLVAIEARLSALLGRPVQLLPEPVGSPRLRANIDHDRQRVF